MSSVGQALGGIVGGAVGFFVGGPTGALYGAQIGMSIGGLLDPPKVQGPRLEDLAVQTGTYGAFIPRIYGTVAQTGNIFWVQGDRLIESSVETNGKGGPTVESFEYSASFAVGLCEGPIDGVRRIWLGGQLYYDAGSSDISTVMASNAAAAGFTLYTGTDTQLADPLIQADRGAANVPAYRGLAYIVFERLPLKNYGNSLAGVQVKVEIVRNQSTSMAEQTYITSTGQFWSGVRYTNERAVAVSYYNTSGLSFDGGQTWRIGTLPATKQWKRPAWNGERWITVCNDTSGAISLDGLVWEALAMPAAVTTWSAINASTDGTFVLLTNLGNVYRSIDSGTTWTQTGTFGGLNWLLMESTGTTFVIVSNAGTTKVSTDDGQTWATGSVTAATWLGLAWNGSVFCLVQQSGTCRYSTDGLTWTTGGTPDAGVVSLAAVGPLLMTCGTALSGINVSANNGVTWTAEYPTTAYPWNCCDGGAGFLLTMDYNSTHSGTYARPAVGVNATLGDIVEAECLKSELLTSSDLDVTELTDSVRGYRVSQLAPIRGSIDPLRKAWPFDVVQHGYDLKFVRRGGASVATIDVGELDAREAGSQPGVQITNVREMDTLMPNKLMLRYLDSAREYDINQQEETRP